MPAALHLLPVRTGGAAENMALDFLLLERYPQPTAARFRHYDWRAASFTFGLSQAMDYVRANLPAGERFDLCRRPTGGGIVDHRHDWTYALVIPRGHALEEKSAIESYRVVHAALAAALAVQGLPAVLQEKRHPIEEGPTVCFERPELYDVINSATREKIAGAAMKRNKHGLLLQGSIERSRTGPIDWGRFHEDFGAALARELGLAAETVPWPELNEAEISGLIEQYSSPEWMEHR